MKKYLAIDIGTTNWKAAVFDTEGNLLAIERCPTKTHVNELGHSFYDPNELWMEVTKLTKLVTAKVGGGINALSVTSMAESVVGIDENHQPVGDIIAWFDNRSMQQAEFLKEKFTTKTLYSITGLDVNPIFSLPKILWLRENQPDVYKKSKKWLQMADYILFKFTGEYVTDYTLASRTLAFDVLQNVWSREILDAVDVDVNTFPTITESATVIGTIDEKTAKETGIDVGVKVVVGGNDHPCASIVAGAVDGNKILDSSGTAESYIYISNKHEQPVMEFKGQRLCRYLQKDRYASWGGIICAGRSFDWAYEAFTSSKVFDIPQDSYTYEHVLASIKDTEAMNTGLMFYPHLRGAGAPYWNPKISGGFVGVRDQHTGKHMLKAVIEGLSMQARMIVEMQQAVSGQDIQTLCVVGGGSKNTLWQQTKATIVQKPVQISDESEATALGAAMLAAIGDKAYSGIEEVSGLLSKKNRILLPDESQKDKVDEFYALYKKGYEAQQELNEQIFKAVKKWH